MIVPVDFPEHDASFTNVDLWCLSMAFLIFLVGLVIIVFLLMRSKSCE